MGQSDEIGEGMAPELANLAPQPERTRGIGDQEVQSLVRGDAARESDGESIAIERARRRFHVFDRLSPGEAIELAVRAHVFDQRAAELVANGVVE